MGLGGSAVGYEFHVACSLGQKKDCSDATNESFMSVRTVFLYILFVRCSVNDSNLYKYTILSCIKEIHYPKKVGEINGSVHHSHIRSYLPRGRRRIRIRSRLRRNLRHIRNHRSWR